MSHTLVNADAIEHLQAMTAGSVHCIVTSPPYFGLRDYGHDGQIGLEETPEAYVARMVEVFREVRRVLRDDGTCWVNLGDAYCSQGGERKYGSSDGGTGRGNAPGARLKSVSGFGDGTWDWIESNQTDEWLSELKQRRATRLKPKDLIGMPWRVAFALQADGWWLRQDIIWHKPSPMPESVTDRCTKAHEYVFLLTKSPTYFFNSVAISEPSAQPDRRRADRIGGNKYGEGVKHSDGSTFTGAATRNRRSVWRIATRPYGGAHFATMPPELAETCIKAGTSEHGCCPQCGTPWQRLTERTKLKRQRPADYVKRTGEAGTGNSCANSVAGVAVKTIGWQQSCDCGCPTADTVPCVVLDPFAGSGTTLAVAKTLGRDSIGIELNPDYVVLAEQRIAEAGTVKAKKRRRSAEVGQGSLFGD